MAFGDSWWSTMAVVPHRAPRGAEQAPTSAASRGRARRRAATRPARGSPGSPSAGGAARACRGQRRVQVVVAADQAGRAAPNVVPPSVARRRRAWAIGSSRATRRRGRGARRPPRRRRRHEADLADALDAVGRPRLRATRRGHVDRRHVLGPEDAERCAASCWSGGRSRVGREVLGERVAEAHVHRALDLALAQQRVHRPADVVDGDDLLDRPVSRSMTTSCAA